LGASPLHPAERGAADRLLYSAAQQHRIIDASAGDGNRVLVDMAPSGSIKIYGSNNQVSWSSKGEVEITTAGPGNTVTRAR
jgi:hypothetical protein